MEVSDSSILDVNVQGNSCLVNALNKGTASISIYYNSNYKYKINFSIKEKSRGWNLESNNAA